MFTIVNRIGLGVAALRRRPTRGAQTVDIMLWVAVFIVVVGGVGVIFRDDLTSFFNSLAYDIGFTR